MDAALLDTDILTEIFKGKNANVRLNATAYLGEYGVFTISQFTHYEVMRGLRAKGVTTKIAAYGQLFRSIDMLPITPEVLDQAATLWADGNKQGQPKSDADILIAATAMVHDRELVTGNSGHFKWIVGLKLANWKER